MIFMLQVQLHLIPFAIILNFMSIMNLCITSFLGFSSKFCVLRKQSLTAFFLFVYLLLGTFILKKKNIQIVQQVSILHNSIQPVDDIPDASTQKIKAVFN